MSKKWLKISSTKDYNNQCEEKLKNTYWTLVIISDGCSRDGQFRKNSWCIRCRKEKSR